MSMVERQDPLSTEVQSPLMAGFSDALNKISDILNLKTAAYQDIPLTPIEISKDDQYRIYQAAFGKKLWLKSPPVVVKKNDVIITDNFTIDYIGGSISFQEDFRLTEYDRVSVDATCLLPESETIKGINTRLDKIEGDTRRNKGYFDTLQDLELKFPIGETGDYAFIGGAIDSIYMWDADSSTWKDIYKEQDLSDYYTKAEVDNEIGNLQNNIDATDSNLQALSAQVQTNKDAIAQNEQSIQQNADDIAANATRIDDVESTITQNKQELMEEIEKKSDKSKSFTVEVSNWTEQNGYFESDAIDISEWQTSDAAKIVVGLSDTATKEERETARNAMLSVRGDEENQQLYIVADGEKPEIALNIVFFVIY